MAGVAFFGSFCALSVGARRIRITEKGKKELQGIMPKMKEVFQLMTAELSLNEKLHAVGFLKQMNDFHASISSNT